MNAYTGIGSRRTPSHILVEMGRLATHLAQDGWALRSGGADGADSAFENGSRQVGGRMEIFLPWQGFNGRRDGIVPSFTPEVYAMAESFHPAWHRCSVGARKLHSRNLFQVLGPDLHTPSQFVLCWTEDGRGEGGTGQAIRIARSHGIPVYDLGDPHLDMSRFADQVRQK